MCYANSCSFVMPLRCVGIFEPTLIASAISLKTHVLLDFYIWIICHIENINENLNLSNKAVVSKFWELIYQHKYIVTLWRFLKSMTYHDKPIHRIGSFPSLSSHSK